MKMGNYILQYWNYENIKHLQKRNNEQFLVLVAVVGARV
jgi:hypothetical protein